MIIYQDSGHHYKSSKPKQLASISRQRLKRATPKRKKKLSSANRKFLKSLGLKVKKK